jgi:hypothetical protein
MAPFSNQEARLAADIPRHRDAPQPLPKTPASSGYKSQDSQRRNQKEKKEKERGEVTVRRKTGGRQLTRVLKN